MKNEINKLLENKEQLSGEEIDFIIKSLNEFKFAKHVRKSTEEIMQNISKEKYDELKVRIRKLKNLSMHVMIPKKFDIVTDMYGGWPDSSKLMLNVSVYGGEDDELIKESDAILGPKKKEIYDEYEQIKQDCITLNLNPDIFILKVINDIELDEEEIRAIIE